MRWKTTVVLLLVTVAVGAYVSKVELRRPTQERQRVLQRQLLQVSSDQITTLAVQFPEAPVTLAREQDRWRLTAPLSARADESLIQRILITLDPLMAQSALDNTPEHPLKLADFGLEPPVGTLTVTTPTHTTQLQFGSQTPIGKSYYAKRGDATTVFVIGPELYDALKQSLEFYRSHDLLDIDMSTVTTLTVAASPGSYALTKQDQAWQLTAPITDVADSATISTVLSRLRQIRIERFISDSPQPHQLTEWGLDAPTPFARITIGFAQADRPPIEILIGNPTIGNPEAVYTKRSDESTVYAVNNTSIQEFLKDPQTLRSHMLFDAFANEIATLRIAGPHTSWTAEFKDGKWAAETTTLDSAKVEEVLWKLRDSKLTRIVEDQPNDLKAYGLDPAKGAIEIGITNKPEPKRIVIGDPIPNSQARYGMIGGRTPVVELPELLNSLWMTSLESLTPTPAAISPSELATPVVVPSAPPSPN